VGRDQSEERARVVDNGQAALPPGHRLGRRDLLVETGPDHRRVGVHYRTGQGVIGCGEEGLDGDEADQPVPVDDGDVRSRFESTHRAQPAQDFAHRLVGPCRGHAG
jgi:hypothetical protein